MTLRYIGLCGPFFVNLMSMKYLFLDFNPTSTVTEVIIIVKIQFMGPMNLFKNV